MEGLGRVGEGGVGVVKDLEGEVGVVLARDEGGQVVGGEAAGPGVDWGLDSEGRRGEGGGGGDAVGGDSGSGRGGEWVEFAPGRA